MGILEPFRHDMAMSGKEEDDVSVLNALRDDIMQIKRNQELILQLLSPETYTIAFMSKATGRSRQAVRDWLTSNAEPDVGFYKKDGKIVVSEKVALQYINDRR
jgi:hypothetical protein